jgi:hypothetical protein
MYFLYANGRRNRPGAHERCMAEAIRSRMARADLEVIPVQPETRYAKSGEVHVAYQVFGEGSVDLVFVPGLISNVEHYWDDPNHARWLRRLARFARVISFDKRGTGLFASSRVSAWDSSRKN